LAGTALSLASEIDTTRQVSSKKPVKISSIQLLFQKLQGLTLFKDLVKAIHGDLTLTSDEIRAYSESNVATAIGHVKVVDKSAGITLTCGNLEYQGLMDTMTAHDHPVLTISDQDGRPVTVTGRQMELDAVKKTIVVNQNVEIVQSQSKAEAQKATFLSKENQMILEGDPRVYTSSAQITGRRIVTKMGEGEGFFAEGMAEAIINPGGEALTTKGPEDKKKVVPASAPVGGPERGGVTPSATPMTTPVATVTAVPTLPAVP
jgi:lipopolysaccharide export system protein LptA